MQVTEGALQMLEPEHYCRFFGSSMTPSIISSIIMALSQHGIECAEPLSRTNELTHDVEAARILPILSQC